MKMGRNDLCPCGSGKKVKKCCGEGRNGSKMGGKVESALLWVLRALAG